MKISQIRELAKAIVKYDGIPEKDLDRFYSHLSRQERKIFVRLLSNEVKENNVLVTFAGELSNVNKNKIEAMFPCRKIIFKRDDADIAGGIRFEYNDFILDCSISGIAKRILNTIKERL
ncbi:MAG: F0F1 ATP synthase subunit delta [Endomicrobium sp.]|jgi:F0F1-type ATP synthase delta subunit|nr:F0F1 ATP synthase subunit delta [Endomicrobium sp.]